MNFSGPTYGNIVVPEGVTTATIEGRAASGDGAQGIGGSFSGGGGGGGARAKVTVAVSPGDLLNYYVGGRGPIPGDTHVSPQNGGYLLFAKAGETLVSQMAGGRGGQASECVGDEKESGGDGQPGQLVLSGTDEFGNPLPAPLVPGGEGGSPDGGAGGAADGGMGYIGGLGGNGWLSVEFS